MQFWHKTLFAAGLTVSFLVGCSSNDVDENPISPLTNINASIEPKISWQVEIGDGVGDYYSQLQPATADGKLYAADRNGLVVALDEQTGQQVWQQDLSDAFKDGKLAKDKGARLSAGLTVAKDKVFIGSETGVLAALDAKTGDLLWHIQTDGELMSLPTVADDMVVVNTGSGTLAAYSIEDGKSLWRFESQMPSLTLRGTGSAVYESGGFFIGTADGKVAVIIKDNGQPAWEQTIYNPTGGNEFSRMADVDMTPLILADKLYAVSYNGNLVSMDLRSGRILWSRKYSSFHNLALSGLSLFLVDDHSLVYAIDRRNGMELWSNAELANRQLTAPVVYKDYIVLGDYDGYLHFLSKSDGKIVGRLHLDSKGFYVSPIVADGKLFVQGRNGVLAAVTLP